MKSIMSRFTTSLVATLALTQPADAFFRNLMIGDTAMARVDPIVNRGGPAPHVHHLNGGRSKCYSLCSRDESDNDRSEL